MSTKFRPTPTAEEMDQAGKSASLRDGGTYLFRCTYAEGPGVADGSKPRKDGSDPTGTAYIKQQWRPLDKEGVIASATQSVNTWLCFPYSAGMAGMPEFLAENGYSEAQIEALAKERKHPMLYKNMLKYIQATGRPLPNRDEVDETTFKNAVFQIMGDFWEDATQLKGDELYFDVKIDPDTGYASLNNPRAKLEAGEVALDGAEDVDL